MGFFTDTSVCIGCKACEVACKEWNHVPADPLGFTGESYDNSGDLGANSWRHVAFIEQKVPVDGVAEAAPDSWVKEAARQQLTEHGLDAHDDGSGFRWLMSSDVCKHCTEAACLDVCPTGVAVPHRVRDGRRPGGHLQRLRLLRARLPLRRPRPAGGRRAGLEVHPLLRPPRDDMEPACAQACPTDSIQFGELDELVERASKRVEQLHDRGHDDARLYGHDPDDGVGGSGAFFLLLDEPEVYGLPPDPVVTTRRLKRNWLAAAGAAAALAIGVAASFVGETR